MSHSRSLALATFALLVLDGCLSGPDTRSERWEGPLDDGKARRIVGESFTMRAHPNPHLDRPRPDHELIAIDGASIRFRARADGSPAQEVYFRDITSITTQEDDDAMTRTVSILVHLAAGSPSAERAVTQGDPMSWLGISDPYLLLPGRDPSLVPHLRRALLHLASRAAPREPTSFDEFLDQYAAEEARRRLEAEAERRRYERIEELLESAGRDEEQHPAGGQDRGQLRRR